MPGTHLIEIFSGLTHLGSEDSIYRLSLHRQNTPQDKLSDIEISTNQNSPNDSNLAYMKHR